jgi:hypothetical protein
MGRKTSLAATLSLHCLPWIVALLKLPLCTTYKELFYANFYHRLHAQGSQSPKQPT